MDTLLEAIDVCDVDGFCYGNYTDEEAGTGCTVIVAPEGATGGVDHLVASLPRSGGQLIIGHRAAAKEISQEFHYIFTSCLQNGYEKSTVRKSHCA